MRPGTATSPTAITLPAEGTARAEQKGLDLATAFSAHLAAMMRADLDGAGEPGSNEGPVQGATRPKRKGAEQRARRSG
jgi:hypothetical protein